MRCEVQAQALYRKSRGLFYIISMLLISLTAILRYVSSQVVRGGQEGCHILYALCAVESF